RAVRRVRRAGGRHRLGPGQVRRRPVHHPLLPAAGPRARFRGAMSRRLLIALVLAGCESAARPTVPPPDAGPLPVDARASDAAAAEPGPPAATTCPAAAPARQSANAAQVVFPIEIQAGGKPMRFGQEVMRKDGVAEKFTLFHAFVAEPFLLDARGGRIGAQLGDEQGRPLPYGLLLVAPEKATTLTLLAPAGSYAGL